MALKPAAVSGLLIAACAGYLGYTTIHVRNQRVVGLLRQQVLEQQQTQDLRVGVAQSLEAIERFRRQLPPSPDSEWLVGQISQAAERVGVQFTTISPQVPRRLGDVTPLPVTVQFTASYEQVRALIDALEHGTSYIRVDELDLARSGQGIAQVRLTVSTLHVPPVPGVASAQ